MKKSYVNVQTSSFVGRRRCLQLGGAMSMFSIAEAGGAGRVAAISAPSSLMRQLHRFAEAVGLSTRGKAAFIASVEAHVGRPASDFDVRRVAGKVDLPLLVIHDQNDRQVPVVEAARAAHVLRGAELASRAGSATTGCSPIRLW